MEGGYCADFFNYGSLYYFNLSCLHFASTKFLTLPVVQRRILYYRHTTVHTLLYGCMNVFLNEFLQY